VIKRAELGFALGWLAFGAAVLVAAWRMDRLESLHINPWSAPGLLPGLLGALIMLFGTALAIRAVARDAGGERSVADSSPLRTWLALVLCFLFAAGLLGHGWLPFWLSAFAFLTVTIAAFRWLDRDAEAPQHPARIALSSAAIALVASVGISLLFQEVFLVRLP
jgi:hypothetical protein